MVEWEPKYKKLGIDLKDVKRLAKQGASKHLGMTMAGAGTQQLVVTFLRELELRTGAHKIKPTDLYNIFSDWCEYRRADSVPTLQDFGLKMKGLVAKKLQRGYNMYCLNKTAAEIRKSHEVQKKKETKKAKREAQKLEEEQEEK